MGSRNTAPQNPTGAVTVATARLAAKPSSPIAPTFTYALSPQQQPRRRGLTANAGTDRLSASG